MGFAVATIIDEAAHLEEVSVHPKHGRRGLGTRLVQAVCDWAEESGYPAVTLSTFRDIPWNAPFYARIGFRTMAEEELGPGLLAVRAHETEDGLIMQQRVFMRRRLDSGYERSAHLYDLFDRKENVDFFYHYATQTGEILDVGAGTGRIAIPLARRGIQVTCVEPSPAMRREFRKKLREEADLQERITLVRGDASSFKLGRTFPVAFLSGSFDHLLDDAERLSALRNIGAHLVTGGVLIFDVFLGLMGDTPLSPAGVVQIGDREIRRFVGGQVLPDRRKETLLVFEITEQGRLVERVEERSLVGITGRAEIHRLLKLAGFEVRKEWAGYDFEPFQEGKPLLLVEAVKKEETG